MADTQLQSSFIPKKPLVGGALSRSGGLFPFIANTIFVIALISSVGVFAYDKFLENRISKMHDDLNTARLALEPDVINQLTQSDKRLLAANTIVKNHVTLSSFFTFLQSLTLQNIRFTSFSIISNEKGLIISMKGQARTYAAVALQAKIFADNPQFLNPQFSNLDLDEKGNVTFSFKTGLDSKVISYVQNLSSNNSMNTSSAAPVQTQTDAAVVGTSSTKVATSSKSTH